jgi:Ca2+-binding EF-hand superfamily protein
MKAINFLAGLGAVILAMPSLAEDASQAWQFSDLDKDNDGYVSIIEAEGQLDMLRNWVDIDKDSNGKLEFSEFSAFETRSEQDSQKAKSFEPLQDEDEPEIGAAPL